MIHSHKTGEPYFNEKSKHTHKNTQHLKTNGHVKTFYIKCFRNFSNSGDGFFLIMRLDICHNIICLITREVANEKLNNVIWGLNKYCSNYFKTIKSIVIYLK
jgi:hypothetical protein